MEDNNRNLDPTEQEQIIKKLKESEKRYREILDKLDQGYYEIDLKGKYTFVNKFQANYLGLSKEELIGTNYGLFYDKKEEKRVFEKFNEVYKKNLPKGLIEVETMGPNGLKRTFKASIYLKYDSNGNKIGFYGTIYDISERKKLELKLAALNKELEKKVDIRTKELRKSEESWRSLGKNVPSIIIIADPDGEIQYVNRGSTGQDVKEVIGSKIYEYIQPEFHDLVKKTIKNVLDTGELGSYEVRVATQQGRTSWYETQVGSIKQDEKIVNVLLISTDITERKQMEQKLLESEENYRLILENANDLISVFDNKFKFEFVNEKIHKSLMGYNKEDLIGKRGLNIVHPDDQEFVAQQLKRLVETGEGGAVARIKHKSGKYLLTETKGTPFKDREGKTKLLLITRDISDRKQSELKLKESEEKYRALFENSPNMILLIDLSGNIVGVNKPFVNFFGLEKQTLIGNKFFRMEGLLQKNRKLYTLKFKEIIEKGFIEPFEVQVFVNEKTLKWITLQALLFEVEGKKLIQVILQDITARKEAEQKLIESKSKYREAYNRAEFYKDLFAHDISNILQHILSAMELSNLLITNPKKLKDIRANLNIIKNQVNRGAKLVSNVRKLSQLEVYKKSITPIEIMKTIKNTIKFIKYSYQERDIDIQVDSISKEVYIQANDLIQDVFENILINAVKHNINPKLEIIVRFSREVFEKIHYLKIEFIDNGVGIDDARKETIFQRAFNEDKSISGMGLGLSLVKKIIDSFNGKIWVEDKVKNDYSKGSNFTILLPEER